ncbi:iron-sulfur protein [Clostridium zeae]|uniref:Ferredoxin n=1 Tax=Clostridium zeae TaxID=2759022 RepID=A0ABQ1E5W2_9CLOT|nr:EFR1 family ferrodoxin [Clostridium zeae]GFZ30142.1 iron-sulfur protein [Clostridium zeae]
MKNRIYFFTGTGNSLKVAEEIAKTLKECELVAINKDVGMEIPEEYERIGFVFPVYFWGLPRMVAEFIKNASFPKQGSTYYFAVATFGGIPGNSISMTSSLLKEKRVQLNYNAGIKMYKNALTFYSMSKNVDKITRESNEKIPLIAKNIENKVTNKSRSINKLIKSIYNKSTSRIHSTDSNFNVNDKCISCGICQKVCPAKNITIENKKPVFHNQCESCLACIQHCPKQAINYKDKTQSRGRYTHPEIGAKKLMEYYK